MHAPHAAPRGRPSPRPRLLLAAAAFACAALNGCAALSNPVGDAVPVRKLPPEVRGLRREEERTIPLTLLRQEKPAVYRLAPGDVLGIWIETVLGDKTQPLPVRIPEQEGVAPAVGYPVPVREDGTLPLPLIPPVRVDGLSLAEAQDEIIKAYTKPKEILKPGNERVLVTLMRPRRYEVLVVRQDTGAIALGGPGVQVGQTKRGTGSVVSLPAYENDVLHALARTGGLPGLDAENEVIIQRGSPRDAADAEALRLRFDCPPPAGGRLGKGPAPEGWVRIPLCLRPDEPVPFRPEDVILRQGDIVFIEARDTEVFYTGGLLPAPQVPLPRDYSIDIVEAISLVSGSLVAGGQSVSNLSGALIQPGLGFPSPSLAVVLRRTPGGGQLPIRIDMNRALRDPRERVLIQPGDIIILQETTLEAVSRYVTNVLQLNFLGTFIRENDLIGTARVTVP